MGEVERATWVVEFLSRAIVEEEQGLCFDLALQRMEKLRQLKVD